MFVQQNLKVLRKQSRAVRGGGGLEGSMSHKRGGGWKGVCPIRGGGGWKGVCPIRGGGVGREYVP